MHPGIPVRSEKLGKEKRKNMMIPDVHSPPVGGRIWSPELEMAQEKVQARSQATTPDSDYSERPAGDPDSRRSSISNLSSEDLRKFVVEERKSYKEERKSYLEQLRHLHVQLDRAEEARARSEEALRARARCCTIM